MILDKPQQAVEISLKHNYFFVAYSDKSEVVMRMRKSPFYLLDSLGEDFEPYQEIYQEGFKPC